MDTRRHSNHRESRRVYETVPTQLEMSCLASLFSRVPSINKKYRRRCDGTEAGFYGVVAVIKRRDPLTSDKRSSDGAGLASLGPRAHLGRSTLPTNGLPEAARSQSTDPITPHGCVEISRHRSSRYFFFYFPSLVMLYKLHFLK